MTSLDELRDRLLAENPYRPGMPLESATREDAWQMGVVATLADLPAWLREQLLSDEVSHALLSVAGPLVRGVSSADGGRWVPLPADVAHRHVRMGMSAALSTFLPDEKGEGDA